ncbi:MAG: putative DNA-binding domain-containing protein [Verrucomicrobia bacterium]|nr:putative DNA-binding domain-containing protein [Verrucomicrobiota bacterium]
MKPAGSRPQNLRALQRLMHRAILRPLAPGDRTQRRWTDGRTAREMAESFVKANDRLTALERLEIYNRMYWFRILDCLYDDYPGLRAALGPRRFHRLAVAYLTRHPSRSFTLRNLGSRLEAFIRRQPRWTAPHTALAAELARFEWAQTVAFDEAARPVVTAAELAKVAAGRIRLALQPYVTLLAVRHPVDAYVRAVKERDALRTEASNAAGRSRVSARLRRVARPRPERGWLAVHRVDNRLYYKRLEPAAYRMLAALRDGRTLEQAVARGGRAVTAEQVRTWFELWTQLGWICRRK